MCMRIDSTDAKAALGFVTLVATVAITLLVLGILGRIAMLPFFASSGTILIVGGSILAIAAIILGHRMHSDYGHHCHLDV